MGNIAIFKTKFRKNRNLSIPEKIVKQLSLKMGEEIKVVIEKEKFNKQGLLALFGIWKNKDEEDVNIYWEILKEREFFGRWEVKL